MSAEPSASEAWGTPLQVYYCPHCHSAHLAPASVTMDTCPACLEAGVSPEPAHLRREPPELVIPFGIEQQARRAVDWQVVVVIAASLALGKALEYSGAG